MVTQEILELSKKLIAFESVTSRPDQLKAVVDFVEDYLRKNTKLKLKRFDVNGKPSLVGVFSSGAKIPDPALRARSGSGILKAGSGRNPTVIFHDHLDVVPGRREQFRPKVVGDRLYGRGASDTKGNGAALMVLAKELSERLASSVKRSVKEDGGELHANLSTLNAPSVGFMFTTDEEIGGQNGTGFLLKQGYRCKFFITLEPTSFNLVPQHKGILWLKIFVKGRAAHASRPWQGVNAGAKAYEGFQKLVKIYPIPKKPEWKTTVNLGGLSGGDAFNKVMDLCEVRLDIRYVEADPPEKIIKDVKKCFPGAKIEIVEKEPPMTTSFDDPWVKKLALSVERVTGKKPEIRKGHGASDGRFYSSVGIPAVQFGTASNGLHTDREYLKISALENFFKILWDFSQNLV